MIVQIKKQNILLVPDMYYIGHCVSCDKAMGAGLAKTLRQTYPGIINGSLIHPNIGDVEIVGRIINIYTKSRYFHKPTYQNFTLAIHSLVSTCISNNIKYLAIPKLGCGLDRLNWDKVYDIITSLFQYVNIEILVCTL